MEPKSVPKIPIVRVAWHDAAFVEFREHNMDEPNHPLGAIQWSVGWLIRDDEDGIMLGVELSEHDGNYRHTLEIPRAQVKKVKRLR